MILTVKEYCKKYKFGGKEISPKSLLRRIQEDMLPWGHTARWLKLNRGVWVIQVPDE